MQMEAAITEYLNELYIRQYTWKTIKGYRTNLNVFTYYCKAQKVEDTADLSLMVVKGFMTYMVKRGNKGTYINSILKTVKSFIQYCYNEESGGFNTRHRFVWCKEEKTVIRTFKPEQVMCMLDDCGGRDFVPVRDRAILTMLFETGMRCYELCCIQDADVHDDFIIINGKNHKQRVVPITAILYKSMKMYEHVRDIMFPDPKCRYYFVSFHGNQLTNSAVEHIVKNHGKTIEGVRVSPHTCRHFFAQQQVKMGTDLYTISRLLGHENIGITQTYLNSLRDDEVIQIAKQKSVLQAMR